METLELGYIRTGKGDRQVGFRAASRSVRGQIPNRFVESESRDRDLGSGSCCWHGYKMQPWQQVRNSPGYPQITNPGELHFGLTPEKLRMPHASRPWNPIIASVLHRAGVIERWGSGTLNVIDWRREGRTPDPSWDSDARTVTVTFLPAEIAVVIPPVTPSVMALLELLRDGKALGAAAIRSGLGLRDRAHVRETYVKPALASGLIEMTLPGKPNSRLQQYRITELGNRALDGGPETGDSSSA